MDPLSNQDSIDVVAAMLQQVSGAVRFLQLGNSVHLLSRLVKFIQNYVFDEARGVNQDNLEYIADILMAVDYQLDGLEKKHPVGKQAMIIGQRSLSQLLAAS
jgi:ABC-type thiamine transport system substrate-binding protein